MKINKKFAIFIIMPLLAVLLAGCAETTINQYVGSDGTIIYEQDTSFEEYVTTYMSQASSTIGQASSTEQLQFTEEMESAGEDGSMGNDMCESFLDEAQNDENYAFFGCLPETYGSKNIAMLKPGTAGNVILDGDYYIYNLAGFFEFNELPVGNEDNEGGEMPEAWADMYKLSVNLFFEDDVISSDIGQIDGNKVSFSYEDLKNISASTTNYTIKAKKKPAATATTREVFLNNKINGDGSGYVESSVIDLDFFNPTRQWGMSDELLKEAFCQYEEAPCIIRDNAIFVKYEADAGTLKVNESQGNYQYNLINAIGFKNLSDNDRKDWLAKNVFPDFMNFTITLPSEIIRADYGTINGNQLTLSNADLKNLKYDSVVVFKKSVSQISSDGITAIKGPLLNNLKGKIVLKVEGRGEAYYINPVNQSIHYLGQAEDAFSVMRQQGLGISNINLAKIPVAVSELKNDDEDGDGLADDFEVAIGSNPTKKDSDGDGYNDNTEVSNGYNPIGSGRSSYNNSFAKLQAGKILLQVEDKGQAWYVNPNDSKRYFLGRPEDAYQVMRKLGLGISNSNLSKIMQNE